MSGTRVTARAPAKINLWLAVHGRRGDGYHELSTLMAALELADELSARASEVPGVRLELGGPRASADIPGDSRNLVWRAAAAVLERAGELGLETAPGLELSIDKQIPSQGGLGGGSSDAATALALAQAALGVELGDDWCRRTLAALGADCVFFREAGPSGLALCEGIGERVTPWPGSPAGWCVVLLVPRVPSPTGRVFGALALPGGSERREVPFAPGFQLEACADLRGRLHNDLEAAALACVPGLAAWRAFLDRQDAAHFRLSGSGSSFYGLFDGREEAVMKLDQLEGEAARSGLELRHQGISALGPGVTRIP